jgi:hypothetical protein
MELKGAFLRREPGAVRGRDIQPDTWDPGDHTASNEPPLAETRVNREPVNQVPEGMPKPANDHDLPEPTLERLPDGGFQGWELVPRTTTRS